MGRWEPVTHEIWDTVVTPCEATGQVVAGRQWIAEVEGVERRFCNPQAEELFRSYILPIRRAAEAAAAAKG